MSRLWQLALALFGFAVLISGCAAISGCAVWKVEELGSPSQLPAAKMAPDTVVLEIAFVRMSGDILAQQDVVWRQIDEQRLPPDLRRRMNENGLRAGVVSSQLPAELRKLLEEKADPLAVTGAATQPGGDVSVSQRKLDSRTGKRGVILSGGLREKLTLLQHKDGQVSGQDFMSAQCLFAVKTFPQGDGRVRMELTPEIEHGAPKQRWVGQDGAFQMESSKDHKVLSTLKMDLLVAPGEVLVITCTPEQVGLGKQFFAESKVGEQKLLMIRLAQTQYDDIFAPESVKKPIATPSEL